MSSASRIGWVEEDLLRDFNALKLELIANGAEICDLSMINPDIAPPRFLLDKLLEASVRPANHRYAVARGIRKLREAFAEKYRKAWDVELNPEDQVCVTMGSKDAIEHALMALGSDGAAVLVGAPTYPTYLSAIRLARLNPVFFAIQDDEQAMLAELERAVLVYKPVAILLNFPNNPTGITVTSQFFLRLRQIAGSAGATIINDFVYGEMQYGETRAASLLQSAPDSAGVAEIYSLSKAYSVPGWRVGALVGDSKIVRELSHLKAHVDYGIFLPIQHAAAAALQQGDEIPASVTSQYQERCQVMAEGLTRMGWDVSSPRAGCSVWARLPEHLRAIGGLAVSRRLLSEAGVAAYPGSAFSPLREGDDTPTGQYNDRLRFAMVAPLPRVRGVLDRLMRWDQSVQGRMKEVKGEASQLV